ncbi:hypothetical protein EZ428_10235 [Pedobacter frigiditerrae]|uniref:Uncharacterized protein n=1 Tax=Pedobacter frigiditerrae TaxID=2530452 RepID=A0A4R0MXT2_9SPHI|nr:hypothetical protein [Pedobacter frigiditerrae]TCC92101.1 hypothetical protein EZ428_10235 [Pedobacter frigiditerrae]
MQNTKKDISLTFLYFLLSTLITGWFIHQKYALYENTQQMLLSGSIAGAKWGIQILAALLFLGKKKFEFIRRISFVCFIGSALLLSYYLIAYLPISNANQFLLALGLCVSVMIFLYFKAINHTHISLKWHFGWVLCLSIAITLQLTIVFHII